MRVRVSKYIDQNAEYREAPLVQRLGYEPSKLETRVRLPDGACVYVSRTCIKISTFIVTT